ncbi:unnamed protein product [Adineta ricciae]|uniref:F-box domain-containing protein n=2 Tax=Adineta ricciae TaxID=249248 RepID=A0A815B687_ADIRI|nr:unnamed protein product [Adineta ricciae]
MSKFEQFPAEVFYLILDYLKTWEIFYYFYNKSQRMSMLLLNYSRYRIDFRSISRDNFDFFLEKIRLTNIISLILSNDNQTPGQIPLFLSLINPSDLFRLHYLSVLHIEEHHLLEFLRHLSRKNLKALTIHCQPSFRFRNHGVELLCLLSSLIFQSKLRYLHFNFWIFEMKSLTWSIQSTLHSLRTDLSSFSEYCLILNYFVNLKTLILNKCSIFDIENIYLSYKFMPPCHLQLKSLSIDKICYVKMETLSLFLSVTPSIKYLKIIGCGSLRNQAFNGNQWKDFIEGKLRSLDKFQFYFQTQRNPQVDVENVSSIINSFSDSFWINSKQWFVACDFIRNLRQIRLYSIPICRTDFYLIPQWNLFSRSTLTSTTTMEQIQKLQVNLSSGMTDENLIHKISFPIRDLFDLSSPSIFPQVDELHFEFDDQWPMNLHELIAIDLSRIVKVSLNIYFDQDSRHQVVIDALNDVFQRMPNIHTVYNMNRTVNAKILCSIVPSHIQHLQTKVKEIHQMKIILQHFQCLSSVEFDFLACSPHFPKTIIKWLKKKQILFEFYCTQYSLQLWLDNN